jgi:hypothetical protein
MNHRIDGVEQRLDKKIGLVFEAVKDVNRANKALAQRVTALEKQIPPAA